MIGFYNYTIIPSIISMLCGFAGIFFASTGSPLGAVYFLMIAGAIDIFDGKVASTKELNMAEKRFNYIIDGLADMINFGIVPIAIAIATSSYAAIQIILLALYPVAVMIRLSYMCVCEEARIEQGSPRVRYYEGFPISYISLILPLFYLFHSLNNTNVFSWMIFIILILCIPAMLYKFKIPKPKFKISLYILGIGVLEVILLLILGKN